MSRITRYITVQLVINTAINNCIVIGLGTVAVVLLGALT